MIALNTHSFTLILLSFTALVNFGIGVYVLWKSPKDSINESFFTFVTGISLWIVGFALLSATKDFFFDKLTHYGGLVTTAGLFVFAQAFPLRKFIRWKRLVIYAPFVIFALFVIPFNLINKGMIVHPDGRLEPIAGPLFPLYGITLLGYIIASFVLFFRSYKVATPHQRLQLNYLFFGIGIFIFCALIFDVALPAWHITQFNLVGPLSSIVFVGATAFAIIRYQLMDIKEVIRRGTIYTILAVCVIAFYLFLLSLITLVLEKTTQTAAVVVGLITTLVGVFSAPQLERYFRKITDRFFFKDRYDYADAMHDLSEILNKNTDLEALSLALCAALQRILRVDKVQLVMTETKHLDNSWTLIPINLDDEFIATLLVGRKLSGDDYTLQDRKLLMTFANQAAVTLKKAELFQQVKNHSIQMEERVRQRTAQLQVAQEEQKQMMLDISHGLQTPLTVLKTDLESVRSGQISESKIKAFEQSIDRISGFIYNLLRLARLETLSLPYTRKPVDLSELVSEVLEYVDTICRERNILVKSYIDPKLNVMGERDRLKELITNLLSNAIKYTHPSKKGSIIVHLKAENKRAVFEVTDSGIGIEAKDLPNIFNRFYKASSQTEGTGLGLAICKRIVDIHDGEITVASKVGVGTKFTVILPLLN